jgi:uncharacterized Zn-binding protein involved in type VI secretion
MAGKPAARVTDPTACPKTGHGTNPIASGSPDTLFDGLPAARLNDPSACGGKIVSGVSSTVFINGLNAATVGSVGDHGNTVTSGSGTVIIGDTHIPAAVTPVSPMQTNAPFDDHFAVICQATGAPLAGVPYNVQLANGTQLTGLTDEAGKTRKIISSTADAVTLVVPEQTEVVIG